MCSEPRSNAASPQAEPLSATATTRCFHCRLVSINLFPVMGHRHNYEELYQAHSSAYGDQPDFQLINALVTIVPGRAIDLGGGQGRHGIALARLGFDVEMVDLCRVGLAQAADRAKSSALPVRPVNCDIASYEPAHSVCVVVGALLFQIPPMDVSIKTARRMGEALASGGLFYFSLPGFDAQTRELAGRLVTEARCRMEWLGNHLVTRAERPRLSVPRRNETRALAIKL